MFLVILLIALGSPWGIYTDIVDSYVHMNLLVQVAYLWHLRDILVFVLYMAVTCFLWHDADGAINNTITFLMLRCF